MPTLDELRAAALADQEAAHPGPSMIDELDDPLTPEEEAALARREPVEDALLLAEATASQAGETVLAACLSRLRLFWTLGEEGRSLRLFDEQLEVVRATLKARGLDGGEEEGAG